jgi:hypothetical protein
MNAKNRSSWWSCIIYPDSVPDNYIDIIKDWHLPVAMSPLHDKDLNPVGDEKKAHWHLIVKFDSLKSYNQVVDITSELNGTIPQIVNSPVGLIRYFVHKDNPEKHQYNWAEITCYSGFDIDDMCFSTESEVDEAFTYLTNLINCECILEYGVFINYLLYSGNIPEANRRLYIRLARKNTIYFNTFISSRRNEFNNLTKRGVSPDEAYVIMQMG